MAVGLMQRIQYYLVGDPLDMLMAKFRLQHALGIAYPSESQMTDIGLGGHIGDGNLIA